MPCMANSESRWALVPARASRTTVTASESTRSNRPPYSAPTVTAASPLAASASRMTGSTWSASSATAARSATDAASARASACSVAVTRRQFVESRFVSHALQLRSIHANHNDGFTTLGP